MKFLKPFLVLLTTALLVRPVWAETADYHLKRLEIQTRAFLAQMEGPPAAQAPLPVDEGAEINQQLNQTANDPTWAEKMVIEDLHSLLSTSETLRDNLDGRNKEEYLRAKIELESLARRLRISTAPLDLSPQDQAGLELVMLELEEAASTLTIQREQMIAAEDNRRRQRSRVSVGVGFGGFGGWGPWGFNRWGGYGGFGPYCGPGFYRPYGTGFYNPYCR